MCGRHIREGGRPAVPPDRPAHEENGFQQVRENIPEISWKYLVDFCCVLTINDILSNIP